MEEDETTEDVIVEETEVEDDDGTDEITEELVLDEIVKKLVIAEETKVDNDTRADEIADELDWDGVAEQLCSDNTAELDVAEAIALLLYLELMVLLLEEDSSTGEDKRGELVVAVDDEVIDIITEVKVADEEGLTHVRTKIFLQTETPMQTSMSRPNRVRRKPMEMRTDTLGEHWKTTQGMRARCLTVCREHCCSQHRSS